MSEVYMPTADEVRGYYAGELNDSGVWEYSLEREREFDRWLAAHDAEITRTALVKISGQVSKKEAEWDRRDGEHAEGMSHAAAKIQCYIAEQIDDMFKKAASRGD